MIGSTTAMNTDETQIRPGRNGGADATAGGGQWGGSLKARQISAAGASLVQMPGDAELERLYDAHASALCAFLLNLMRDEADTRDVLQEVFVKIVRDGNLLRGVREERAFLIRLAHNAAIDLMRRRGTRERTKVNLAEVLSPFAPARDPDEEMFRNELSAALAELPEEQRAVAHLKLWGGLTFEAIAGALEISPNTAASRYRYALDKLRERLRPLYEELKHE